MANSFIISNEKTHPTPSLSHSGDQPIPLDYCMTMIHVTTDMITCCKQKMHMRTNLVTPVRIKAIFQLLN